MTAPAIRNPLPYFTTAAGQPLSNGYVYFGETSQNPRSSPVSVFYDAALTIPATQPLRTSGGYVYRNGAPARIYTEEDCSLLILDADERQVAYLATGGVESSADSLHNATLNYVAGTIGAVLNDVCINVKMFPWLAVGDGVTDDTAAITAAYAAARTLGAELVFPGGTYAVTQVTFDNEGVFIRFLGSARLKGIATVATPAVLQITCRQMVGWNFHVDQNFNSNYTKGAVWWNSVDVANPAQFNRIFGFKISNALNGIVYGNVIGSASVNAPQSENTIFGLTTRAVQVPFVGNQTNGFITLVSPILDCNPNEWTAQPGYNAATWNTAAMCFNNPTAGNNHLTIIGGELLKTTSTLGYGFKGGSVVILAPSAMEIAGVQGYLDGSLTISDSQNGAMTCGGAVNSAFNAFVIDPAASALAQLTLRNYALTRPFTSSVNSTASFIVAASGTPAMPVVIQDCQLIEWRWDTTVPLCGTGVYLKKIDNTFITVASSASNTLQNSPAIGIGAAAYTVLDGDVEIIAGFAGAMTVTLPAGAKYTGRYLRFLSLVAFTTSSASANVIPLGAGAAGTAILAAAAGRWCEMQYDGTNWRIMRAN